jgi:hypothetical protein
MTTCEVSSKRRYALISRSFAEVMTVVLSALKFAGCRVDFDALPIAPMPFGDVDVVAEGAQALDGRIRKAGFEVENIR